MATQSPTTPFKSDPKAAQLRFRPTAGGTAIAVELQDGSVLAMATAGTALLALGVKDAVRVTWAQAVLLAQHERRVDGAVREVIARKGLEAHARARHGEWRTAEAFDQ